MNFLNRFPTTRKLLLSILFLASSLTAGTSPSFAASAELIRLLDSAIGRYLVSESSRGADLVMRSMGRTLGSGEDIGVFLARLDEPEMANVARKLEEGLKRVERRMGRTSATQRLSATEKSNLNRFFAQELRIPHKFFPVISTYNYDSTRAFFLRMLEVQAAGSGKLKRYPLGVNPLSHPEWNLQFGFESEYVMKNAGELLKAYGPTPEFGISAGRWQNMRPQERVQWVEEHLTQLFPSTRQPGKLVKITHDPELSFMPDHLILDDTKNLEIVLSPVETFEEWENMVLTINRNFGTGSMQGTVSIPSDAFFGRVPGQSTSTAIQENLGFFNFMNDLDTLQKLESGSKRYIQDSTKEVTKSFNHPFLGPMNEKKQALLEKFVRANANGRMLDRETLKQISGSDASFKYIGGTSYRPDIAGPVRVVLEVRDAHTQMEILLDRMLRSTFYLQFGRSQFGAAANLKAFDSVRDYAKLSQNVRKMLEDIFPSKAIPGIPYDHDEKLALEVFRNFSYPLKDWSPNLQFLGQTKLNPYVQHAQKAYVAKLERIAQAYHRRWITKEQAQVQSQGAVAYFSEESGLTEAYRQWQSRNLLSNRAWTKYMDITLQELAPLQHAFPKSVWEGSLDSRVARLLTRWPNNVKLVDNVKFPFKAEGSNHTNYSARKVLVISGDGLNSAEKKQFLADYLDAMARGTVSFPLGENAGHLYTRIGQETYDFLGGLNTREYSFTSGTRLEAFVKLTPEEELKLRFYAEMGSRDANGVIGSFSPYPYIGVKSGRTNGRLRDNRPAGNETHNCTSWVCTTPVGANQEALLELVGAAANWEIHTNPGWWSYYLTGAAKSDRIPFVAYWTNDSMANTLRNIRSGAAFPEWNFYLH